MHHIKYESNFTIFLTEEEILNPYSILEETFKENSSPTQIQDELYEILVLAVRENYWKNYDSPLVLYKMCKKLIRLLEAGWLIQKLGREHTLSENIPIPYKKIKIDNKKKEKFKKQSDSTVTAYLELVNVYNEEPLYSVRLELFNLFFKGLKPTTFINQYAFEEYIMDAFQKIDIMIKTLQIIYNHKQTKALSVREIEKLTLEKDKFKARDTIYKYEHGIDYLFTLSNKEEVIKAIPISKKILARKNFWKLHDNPANILHYYHDFLFALDFYWSHYQYLVKNGIDINTKWEYTKAEKQELDGKGYKWIKKPGNYLEDQFKKKPLQEWQGMLERCLEDVLSNQKIKKETRRDHEEILDFIDGLLFLEGLSYYELKI